MLDAVQLLLLPRNADVPRQATQAPPLVLVFVDATD
jgi:hypothetical protein